MSKQTAVQWLKERLPRPNSELDIWYNDLIKQALQMEREQIIDAYYYDPNCDEIKDDGEQYYEQTYGGNK